MSGPPNTHPTRGREVSRKLIHVTAALGAAAVAWLLPGSAARTIITAMAALAVVIDFARLRLPVVSRTFQRVVGTMLRGRERHRLTGATTLAIGFAGAVLLFPTTTAAIAFLYAGLGDTAAALVGRAWGRHAIPGGKTVEGSLAFFAVAMMIGLAAPGVAVVAALSAALVTTVVEAGPGADNVWVPLAAAATLTLVGGVA